MVEKSDIAAGDVVLYSASFLKSVPGIDGHRKGKALAIEIIGEQKYVRVEWADEPGQTKLALARNLRAQRALYLEL